MSRGRKWAIFLIMAVFLAAVGWAENDVSHARDTLITVWGDKGACSEVIYGSQHTVTRLGVYELKLFEEDASAMRRFLLGDSVETLWTLSYVLLALVGFACACLLLLYRKTSPTSLSALNIGLRFVIAIVAGFICFEIMKLPPLLLKETLRSTSKIPVAAGCPPLATDSLTNSIFGGFQVFPILAGLFFCQFFDELPALLDNIFGFLGNFFKPREQRTR